MASQKKMLLRGVGAILLKLRWLFKGYKAAMAFRYTVIMKAPGCKGSSPELFWLHYENGVLSDSR